MDIEARTRIVGGWTPLFFAAHAGSIESVRIANPSTRTLTLAQTQTRDLNPGGLSELDSLHSSPELWLSPPQAGAMAHIDGHISYTMSLQLSGRKDPPSPTTNPNPTPNPSPNNPSDGG